MSTVSDIWHAWTTVVQINPPPNQDDATDILQTFAPTVSDEDGDAWWVAVATEFDRLGLIVLPKYLMLRNFVDGNEAGANELFDALLLSINALPESSVVNVALAADNVAAQLTAIPGNIVAMEVLKTVGTSVSDVQFDTALDQGIFALQGLQTQLSQ